MKKYILILLAVVFSCKSPSKGEGKVIIEFANSYKVELNGSDGVYSIFFWSKNPLEIKFQLSSEEKQRIAKAKSDFDNDEQFERFIISDSCFVSPTNFTKISLWSGGRVNKIEINESCNRYLSTDVKLALQLKEFILLIKSIMNSKKEIQNAPKSDVFYF